MSNISSTERVLNTHRQNPGEMRISESAVTKYQYTIEIHHDTVTFLERVVEEMQDLLSPFVEFLSEILQSIHSLASEDHKTLLQFSTGILMVNWIACNILAPIAEILLPQPTETDFSLPLPSRLFREMVTVLDFAFASLDDTAKRYNGENITSILRDEIGVIDHSRNDFTTAEIMPLWFLSPTGVMVVGPIVVMILTAIIADNEYHLFATFLAPMVTNIRSSFALTTPSYEEHYHRLHNNDRENYDSILWGILVLFCLESLLVGSILVLMVLISLSLSTVASLMSDHNSEVWEETTRFLIGLSFTWVACVMTSNALRMVLYQNIDSDN